MTATQNQNADTTAADMAALDALLGDGSGEIQQLDLMGGLDDIGVTADAAGDDLLASMLGDEGAGTASAAAPSDDDLGELDLDMDLDLDESALMEAAASAEGLENADQLPETASADAAPEAKAAEPAAAAAPKAPRQRAAVGVSNRTTYANSKTSDVLKSRLNGNVQDDLVLEVADADLTPEQLKAKQQELLDILNVRPHQSKDSSTQKKVAEKVVMLFGYLKNGGKLNEVLSRTFRVLVKDGYVQMGKQGNLFADLLNKPYSVGTANAQGGQMMQMLPLLKIALPDASNKGRLVANPDSVILMRMVQVLGLDK